MMEAGLKIGVETTKASLTALADAIVRVMNQPGDQETIRRGLQVLENMCKVENLTVRDVCITGDKTINAS